MNRFLEFIKRIFKLEEKLNNLIRYGVIAEVNASNNTVIVSFGESLQSPPLPYIVNASGSARVYFVPKVGDQVMILSGGGNINQGVVLPCIYRQGENQAKVEEWGLVFSKGHIKYADGVLSIEGSEVNIISKRATIAADQIILGDESGGEVVCKMHTCSFSGGPHTMGSSKIKGAM